MAEQGTQKMACIDTMIDQELSKIVGLEGLKVQLRKWFKGMLLDQRRRALGLIVGRRTLPQLAFLGNPGTGKTMVARMLAKLLKMVGILAIDKVVEVQRTDLVGKYIGQTGPLTREKIKEAEGGILFVDEAYRLVRESTSYKDYGLEALEEIMSFMDSGKIVAIFAGYAKPMGHVLCSNEGMRRRISNIFHFDDFSCEQLANILHLKLRTKNENSPFCGFKLDPVCTGVKDVAALIKRGTSAEQRRKMNGGLVEQMLVKARENLDSRIDVNCTDEYSLVAITKEDLRIGLELLRAEEENRGGYYSQILSGTGINTKNRGGYYSQILSGTGINTKNRGGYYSQILSGTGINTKNRGGYYSQILSGMNTKFSCRECGFYFLLFFCSIVLLSSVYWHQIPYPN